MILIILMILSTVLLRSCSSLVINKSVRMSVSSSSQEASNQRRILCYGDSLTAGTSPPFNELLPYGPYLETELNASIEEEVVVRWRGLPGSADGRLH